MHVIGTGVGRTGTYSLKLALNQLGIGPCHHMESVLHNMPTQLPLWSAALKGKGDWNTLYQGFNSAVDWPTAGFFKSLLSVYPHAKYVLTKRSPENWADSFNSTIYTLISNKDQAPVEMQKWLQIVIDVIEKTGFPLGLNRDSLITAFNKHNQSVIETIPAKQLLVFEVKQGWEPLCKFLNIPIPSESFPCTNDRLEFWGRVNGKV